ncbi:MAG: ferredoxin [Thermoprotei archaeon]|nr:MAG: ferredoxin [Thermoprotei archaeon]
MLEIKIIIDEDKCIGCGQCVVSCQNNVYEIINEKSKVIRPENCTYCRACIIRCPTSAIKIIPRDVYAYYAKFYEE